MGMYRSESERRVSWHLYEVVVKASRGRSSSAGGAIVTSTRAARESKGMSMRCTVDGSTCALPSGAKEKSKGAEPSGANARVTTWHGHGAWPKSRRGLESSAHRPRATRVPAQLKVQRAALLMEPRRSILCAHLMGPCPAAPFTSVSGLLL